MTDGKLTGETITDDQIRALREEAWDAYANACRALGFSPNNNGPVCSDLGAMREHRYRCAEILNARLEAK